MTTECMKKIATAVTKKTSPSKERIEKIARQLCKQAGEDPDGVIVWEGEYGYGKYRFSNWEKFRGKAKKLLAQDEADA